MNQELNDTSIFFSESEDDIGDSRVGVRSVLRYREQSRLELHKRLKSCPVPKGQQFKYMKGGGGKLAVVTARARSSFINSAIYILKFSTVISAKSSAGL
jgi:hypothetical protein